jgi:4-amino-4-deoxy-L-arabinose transferase-like glycosyltransferase
MQMLARGRLWMPAHPLAEFFESFQVIERPVYASMYFPGTALMYVPTVWLRLPFWVGPALASGIIVALMYRVVAGFSDRLDGLLAALLLLSLMRFRYLSLIVMSQTTMLLLGLAMVWAYQRWRARPSNAWALVLGVLIGWAAITRPLDALIYAIPVAIGMACDLLGQSWRKWLSTGALVVLGAAPFLSIQLIADKGITGEWLKTPYRLNAERNSPELVLGFSGLDPAFRPHSDLPQKQAYFEQSSIPAAAKHQSQSLFRIWLKERLPLLIAVTLPTSALVVFAPIGVVGLRRRAWMLAAVLPLFILGYALFPYLLEHYCVVAAPGVIMLVVAGGRVITNLTGRGRAGVGTFVTLAIAGIAISQLPELDRAIRDDAFKLPIMVYSHKYLPTQVRMPALVLFTYRPGASIHEEPVYNESVAWPDDAEIIRAHDLGPVRSQALIDYYAKLQPNRHVYILDRGNLDLRYYGTAAEFSRRIATTQP